MLARMLVDQGTYNAKEALKAYIYWLNLILSTAVQPLPLAFAAGPIPTARPTGP